MALPAHLANSKNPNELLAWLVSRKFGVQGPSVPSASCYTRKSSLYDLGVDDDTSSISMVIPLARPTFGRKQFDLHLHSLGVLMVVDQPRTTKLPVTCSHCRQPQSNSGNSDSSCSLEHTLNWKEMVESLA